MCFVRLDEVIWFIYHLSLIIRAFRPLLAQIAVVFDWIHRGYISIILPKDIIVIMTLIYDLAFSKFPAAWPNTEIDFSSNVVSMETSASGCTWTGYILFPKSLNVLKRCALTRFLQIQRYQNAINQNGHRIALVSMVTVVWETRLF